MISDELKGNLTTILDFVFLIIAPYCATYGITQSQFLAVGLAVIGLILGYYNSKHDDDLIQTVNRGGNDGA